MVTSPAALVVPTRFPSQDLIRDDAEMSAWRDYQEKVAAHFRSLGLNPETDVTLQGVRTTHDIDVVVRISHVGFVHI
jgi:hypothetical protein